MHLSQSTSRIMQNDSWEMHLSHTIFMQMGGKKLRLCFTGMPFAVCGNISSPKAAATNPLPSMFPVSSAPPLLPRSSYGSPHTVKRGGSGCCFGSPLKVVSEPVKEYIPQVYVHCPDWTSIII